MSDNLTNISEDGLLDHLVGNATFSVTTPLSLALMTANGNDSTPGTEVTGGSYSRQTIAFNNASSGSVDNSAIINFTGMPAVTVVGIEVYDSTGTPQRLFYGALSESKTVASGDTVQFAAGSISLSLS